MAESKQASNKPARPGLGLFGALAVLACLLALLPGSALAASAGLKPSEAPLVEVGQHYFGNTAHIGNAGSEDPIDLWLLPPLLTGDAITIAWHSEGPELCLAQNIDDYSWAEYDNICNGSDRYEVAGNGSARSVIEAKDATAGAYLEFTKFVSGCEGCSHSAYDFTIESIQHAIGVGLTPVASITPTSALSGTASLSNGSPVPDNLVFALTASWVTPVNKATHNRIYQAASSGGNLRFALNLPASAEGKKVSFTVTRGADPQYREAASAAVEIPVVATPKPEVAPVPTHHRRHKHHRRHHRHRHHHRR